MVRFAPALALTASLTACGGGGGEQQPVQKIRVQGEAQRQLHQLSDMNRHIGLKRAILASGQRCRRVDSSGYVQEHNNLSMWMARCDDKVEWAIFVGPDGSAQVRRCSEMAQLNLPACVMRPSQPKPA